MHQGHKIFTNSCIELSIPFEYQQYNTILCNWSSTPSRPHDTYLAQWLTLQPRMMRFNDRTYYLCSPLDAGCGIGVRVEAQGGQGQGNVIEELRYGPVEVQPGLTGGAAHWNHVEILLNKNVKKHATIHIETQPQPHKQKPTHSLTIALKLPTLSLQLPLTETLAKAQLQSFEKSPFFKLYDSEPNTVGLLIGYRMAQFVEKMKELNIFNFMGNYLKVCFESRVSRDFFILGVFGAVGVGVQGVREVRDRMLALEAGKAKVNGANGPVNNLTEAKNTLKQLLKIPKIQSVVRASQIMGTQFLSASQVQTQHQNPSKPQQNILEDIYNILYSPVAKIQRQSVHGKDQNGHQRNFISGAMDIEERSIQINEEEDAIEVVEEEKLERKRFPYKKHRTLNDESELKQESIGFAKLTKKQPNSTSPVHPESHPYNFHQQLKQITLLQKLTELTKINEDLLSQNKRLKLENERLKSDETKHQKIRELNKMIQIKAMVQMMARKLEHLQGSLQGKDREGLLVPLASPRNFVDRGRNQKKDSKGNVQNSKRLWSPRAHHELMKTIKQKNVDDKNHSIKGNQLARKKSVSHFNSHEEPKLTKKQLGSMKQCPSFGKNNNFVPLNVPEPMESKPRASKPELYQTSQLGQFSKRTKQALFTSTKDFLSPTDSHRPNQKTHQLASSPSQPIFRNVFGSE